MDLSTKATSILEIRRKRGGADELKFLTYEYKMFGPRAGVLSTDGTQVLDLTALLGAAQPIADIGELLSRYEEPRVAVERAIQAINDLSFCSISLDTIRLCAPILHPANIRDGSIFERHVVNAGKHNGVGTPANWYKWPTFYFQNTNVVLGPDAEVSRRKDSTTLDYEAEIALVIGKRGRSIPEDQALEHIFGLTIYNDWSDRERCTAEVGFIGLHKGKDFANAFGPYIVTMDEVMDHYQNGRLTLKVDAWVNDVHTTDSLTDDAYWTIPQLIEYISRDADIVPGDIIGLGTVGTGCIYERPNQFPYLEDGDVVTITVEKLGTLRGYVSKG